MRNNIYFFYLKEKMDSINIGYFIDNIFYDFNGNIIGKKYELFNDTSLVIAPIDILLYHIPSLEYLNRRYSEEEKIRLKKHDMSTINSRMIKYFYNTEEIANLKKEGSYLAHYKDVIQGYIVSKCWVVESSIKYYSNDYY